MSDSDHQPTLVRPPEPPPGDDLAELPALLARIERTGGRAAIRAREMMLLLRVCRRYAPIAEPVKAKLPSVLSTPSCPDCGFAVAVRGERCAACKQKEGARAKPLFETGAQPRPAYAREQEAPAEE